MGERPNQPEEEQNPGKGKLLSKAALLTVLGLGMMKDAPLSHLTPEEKAKEAQLEKQQKSFELPPELAARFHEDKERRVSGERMLIHIGQMHFSNNLRQSERLETAASIIKNQKDIEKVILYVKEAYGIDAVLLEGLVVDHGPNEMPFVEVANEWDTLYNEYLQRSDFEKIHEIFNKLVDHFNLNAKKHPENFALLGSEGYFLAQRAQKFEKYIANLKGKIEVPEYITDRIKAIREGAEKLEVNQGDNKYVFMSSAVVLWMDGKIKLIRCDDNEALKASNALTVPVLGSSQEVDQNYVKAVYEFSQKREDSVLRIANDWMKENKFSYALVVFGNGHDFSANAMARNETVTTSDTCGVITYSSLEAEEYFARWKSPGNEIFDPKKKK